MFRGLGRSHFQSATGREYLSSLAGAPLGPGMHKDLEFSELPADAYAMGRDATELDEVGAIRQVLQRVCRSGASVVLRHGGQRREFPLLAESPQTLTLNVSELEAQQWELPVGSKLDLELRDRGRRYRAITFLMGFSGSPPALQASLPRTLTWLDPEEFSDFCPPNPMHGSYATVTLDIRNGRFVAFSEQGLQMEAKGDLSAELRLETPLMVSLDLGQANKLVLQVAPAYFNDRGVGLRVLPASDPSMVQQYAGWVRDRLHEERERDRRAFTPEGVRLERVATPTGVARHTLKHLVQRDPQVLLVAEDTALAAHLAQALGRKFGISHLDYLQGLLRPQLDPEGEGWGCFRLLLIHQRLFLGSGFELVHQVVEREQCPLPVLLVGSDEDLALKRNRAIAAGAIDYLALEPFKVISVMQTLQQTLNLCG